MKNIFTIADFCTNYLQGEEGYKISGQHLNKYHGILKNLIEFNNNQLFIIDYPHFYMGAYNNVTYNVVNYLFNEDVLKVLQNNKYIFLYSIGARLIDTIGSNNKKGIEIRFYATNTMPIISYEFELESSPLINNITYQLSKLTNEELEELNSKLIKKEKNAKL